VQEKSFDRNTWLESEMRSVLTELLRIEVNDPRLTGVTLEGEMRSVLSELLRVEVNDPRLTDVTVSLVRLSADRSKAKVYFSVIGDEERRPVVRRPIESQGVLLGDRR